MCGIVGIIKFNGEAVRREELEKLNTAIYHRGPDEDGFYLENNVGLAMRRLSIIDLSTGSQPMTSQDGNLVIVFNGEIYNFREVRNDLENHGMCFKTNSDTEVIISGYQFWGPAVLDKFIGMWGIAIYDKQKRELFLARDRLGKKQLYYAINDRYIVFGSEMKIPMLYDPHNRKLRLSALPEYLTYSYIGGPETAVEGIKLLPEAHWAKISQDGKLVLKKYWEIAPDYSQNTPKTEVEAADGAYHILVDAVKQRLVADVPVSVMLSSGLDLSACAYILAKELGTRLKTFSLGYSDKDFDESNDAGKFAKKMDMPWEKLTISGNDVAMGFSNFIAHCDSLQSNTAQLVYYFVNKVIRTVGYKVAINGSGGDELFAGYKTYQANTLFSYYRKLPPWFSNILMKSSQLIPASFGRVSTDYMLKKFTECPYRNPQQSHAYWRTIFSSTGLIEILSPDIWKSLPPFTRIYDEAFSQVGGPDLVINNYLCADLKGWLIPMLPGRVDNMSMAHSVELRLPFLDHRLVAYALNLPPKFLFDGWTLKKMMKLFLKGRLPDEVLFRRKRGTHLPISRWLNSELSQIRDTYLNASILNRENLFNMKAVNQLIQQHQEFRADHTFKLWGLIVFSAWKEHNGVAI